MPVPKMLTPHHLPKVLDPSWILSQKQLRQILYRPDDASGVPLQGRLTPAKQTRLIRQNLDEHPIAHPGVTYKRFDAGDFHG